MKKKLNTLFILVALSLSGIIVLQLYWSYNAYRVNKSKFDTEVDAAMQRAMDDCKKDYFDSLRTVLVNRLSAPSIKITLDTIPKTDSIIVGLDIVTTRAHVFFGYHNYALTIGQLNYYRTKINRPTTLPELITEISFYVPVLMDNLRIVLGTQDLMTHTIEVTHTAKKNSKGIMVISSSIKEFGIFELPKNTQSVDSIKLNAYFKNELQRNHITSGYELKFSENPSPPQKLNLHYSETAEYSYKYHGFVLVGSYGPEYFARAIFRNPQHTVLKQMLIPLCLSILLILFMLYCFNYIIRLVIHQKKLAELKDDFINNMTHELKTPIATITVAIEGLQKFNALNDTEKTQRYLHTSQAELLKLNSLVTKVLNIAAFENKDIELVKEKININELINEIISSEKIKTSKQVDFIYTNRDNLTWIYADRLHFSNVLGNLVDNAVKYSNEPVKVIITCFKQGESAAFSIKDNGIGIPAAHIRQVFDKFHRVPTGNIHNVKGTGLGLSYSMYIVKAHGGDITVKSETNAGSDFTVSIPLKNE